MSINNLHGLINGQWFIEAAYSQSLLPTLFSILSGKSNLKASKRRFSEAFISSKNKALVSADSFDNSKNKEAYVLVLSLKNPIYKYNQECGPKGTKYKQQIMAGYEKDSNCAGVVLDIDSGGGQVSGTPEFYDFIKNYSKPVVAYTDGMMCSAAYYIGSASKHIIANKRVDAIGSIGTMISFVDMNGYYEKKGAKVITEYATKSTRKNKNFEDLLNGDPKGYIKNVLDPITETFHEDMKAVRPSLKEEVLTGGTYNSEKSLSLGLIDEIGTIQTAIDKVLSLSKTNSNSNNKNMSNTKVPLIEAILGADFSNAQNESGFLLTDVQAETIENELKTKTDSLTETTANLKTANDLAVKNETELKTANENATAVTNEIQKALVTAEVANADKLSNQEGVVKLSALVTEYGAKDGGKTTEVIPNSGTETEVSNQIVSGVNLTAAFNN